MTAAPGFAVAQDQALPEQFVTSGVVRVGIQNQYAPLNYIDPTSKEFTGFNVDLFAALGEQMGVKMELVVASFPDLIPGLASSRFDLIGAGMTDNATRRETLTFVDYLTSGAVLMTTKDAAADLPTAASICGSTIAHARIVASFGQILERFNQNVCPADAPIKVVTDDLPVQLGLAQGRYQAALVSQELYLYLNTSQPDKFAQIGDVIEPTFLGIAFTKGDDELRDALKQGMQTLIDNGRYGEILSKYGMTDMGVEHLTVDATGR